MSENKKIQYLAVEDIAQNLGIPESDIMRMLGKHSPPTRRDHRGRLAVPITYIHKLTDSDDYLRTVGRAVAAESRLRQKDKGTTDELFKKRRAQLLIRYNSLILDLENFHRKYLLVANRSGPESHGMASYLLLSRAISTLNMMCACLRDGHWYSGSLLRNIDECLDLAHYFSITKAAPYGEATRLRWFRENISPSHADCREAISKWHSSLSNNSEPAEHLELMKELYRKKSKWTHPTYLAIQEIAEYETDGSRRLVRLDYGPCNYERKLYELADFFRSSIWSSFQTLFTCFHLEFGLEDEDLNSLLGYDKMFQEWSNEA